MELQEVLVSCLNTTRCCKKMATGFLDLMASFAVVVKAGSFTRAATRLGLSKSVVSRHVTALERRLGVQLMYRSTHQLMLTEAGERFFARCKDLEGLAEEAVTAATAERERPRGLLRVTLPQMLVVSPVGTLITRFQRTYPEVQLDVRVTSLQIDPIEEGFDLALRLGSLRDSSLTFEKIREARVIAVAAPSYLKRHSLPRTREELKSRNCLAFSEFGARTRWPAHAGTRGSGPVPSLSTNSGVLMMNALLDGQGIVIGPDLLFEPYIRRRRLRVVFDDMEPEAPGLYAVYPPGRISPANRKAFVGYLAAGLER
jgi:DNA-binding transcriptional LysR family regulator